ILTVTPVVAAGGAAAVEALCPPGKLVITFSFSIQQSLKSLRSYSSCRVDVAQRFPSAAKACKFSSLYRRPQGLLHPVGTQQLRSIPPYLRLASKPDPPWLKSGCMLTTPNCRSSFSPCAPMAHSKRILLPGTPTFEVSPPA